MRLFTCLVLLCCSATAWAQTDSVALSTEYYNQGMEVYGFAHAKQASELFILANPGEPEERKGPTDGRQIHSRHHYRKRSRSSTFVAPGNWIPMLIPTYSTLSDKAIITRRSSIAQLYFTIVTIASSRDH
ncbi:MAG: hypothetical protein WDO15_06765 [Bacteroidota bacterium]